MRKYYLAFALISLTLFCAGQYTWTLRPCLPGAPRTATASFGVGNKGYVICGFTAAAINGISEVWQFDDATNTWTQKNNFPSARSGPAVFVINDTAYAGIGLDVSGTYLTDFYRYDVPSDSWIPLANFPGTPRYFSMTFALNGKGYLGCGKGATQYGDFYQYDPASNTWTQKASFPGGPRQNGFGVSVGQYGYMGLGYFSSAFNDAYRYDPSTDTWLTMATFAGAPRYGVGYFVISDTFYVLAGRDPYFGDCWRYDVASNMWVPQEGFQCLAPPRAAAFGFTIGKHGFTCTGDLGSGVYTNDLLEFGTADLSFSQRVHVLGNDTAYCGNFSRVLSTGDSCTKWSTGQVGPQITIATAGTYSAFFPGNCNMATDTIIIGQSGAVTNLGNDTTYCGSFTRILSTGIPATVWSTGVTASQITVDTGGVYWASYTSGCGSGSDTIIIRQGAPAASLGGDTNYCGAFSRILSTGISSTVWSTGVTGAQITITSPGVYWAHFSSGCGKGSDTITITQGAPTANFGADTTYCGAFSRTLFTGVGTTVWSTGVTASQITVTTPGTYWASVSDACGSATDTITIAQKPAPVVNFGPDTLLCYPDSLILNAGNSNSSYQWQDNSTNPTFKVTTTGTYSVTVTDTSGCSVKDTITATYAWESPQPDLGEDIQICGDSTLLRAGISNAHYLWNDGSTDSVDHVYTTGIYSVTVTDGCGTGSAGVNVNIHPDDCALMIPTGFSPNGDGKNDVFHAVCHCPASQFTMHIYNRWGELVYQSNNITEGWDGTMHLKQQPMGVYVYYLEYFNMCENKLKKIGGNVTLVR